MSVRTERVASLIRHELAKIINSSYNDGELGFSTITEIRMTQDLKLAKVYVSIMGTDEVREKTMKNFVTHKAQLRTELASKIQMKFAPDLQFFQDLSLDRAQRLEELFKQIHKDDKK